MLMGVAQVATTILPISVVKQSMPLGFKGYRTAKTKKWDFQPFVLGDLSCGFQWPIKSDGLIA